MPEMSYTPVRRGHRYCSTACGHGCTYGDYTRAVRSGKALARTLGRGWTYRVWENLGWHFDAEHPTGVAVHQYAPRYYWATTTGPRRNQVCASAKTARAAVRALVEEALTIAADYQRLAQSIYPSATA